MVLYWFWALRFDGIWVVFVMKYLKLATISVLYSISMVLLLTGVGVVFFRESLNYYEIGGLIMAIGSLILLMRFA